MKQESPTRKNKFGHTLKIGDIVLVAASGGRGSGSQQIGVITNIVKRVSVHCFTKYGSGVTAFANYENMVPLTDDMVDRFSYAADLRHIAEKYKNMFQ